MDPKITPPRVDRPKFKRVSDKDDVGGIHLRNSAFKRLPADSAENRAPHNVTMVHGPLLTTDNPGPGFISTPFFKK